MFSVTEWLDRAKARAGGITDYRLAKMLGVSSAAISGYRAGIRFPDERIAVKLCALSGDDPEHVVACIQSMRAANDETADIWRRVAARLAGGANVIALVAIAAVLGATVEGWTGEAADALLSPTTASLYIMLIAVVRLACRLALKPVRIRAARAALVRLLSRTPSAPQ